MTIESTAPHRIPPPSREKQISLFEQEWRQVNELKPWHKEAIKQYFSFKQGRDGTRGLCCFCNVDFGFRQLQIHHIDHNRKNNQLSNVQVACEGCNNEERKVWLAERARAHNATHRIGAQLKRENNSDMQEAEKLLQEQLLKQAPTTFQKSVSYKKQVLAYLTEYVKEKKSFDTATADVEALTGCSHAKAIEYLNAFSLSVFAPWHQYSNESGQWIMPRQGSEAYKKVQEKAGQ